MNSAPSQTSFGFPTREVIEGWRAECDRIMAKIAELQAQHDGYASMIQGAQALLPFVADTTAVKQATADVRAQSEAPRRRGRPPKIAPAALPPKTWTGTIEQIVHGAGRLSYEELRAAIAETPFAKKLMENDKGFYGGVGKLADAGRLVRHNGWLYSPQRHKNHMRDVAAGRSQDDPAPKSNSQHSPFGEAIKSFLEKSKSGASSSEIINELRKTPDFYDTIERHSSHVYNVLSRLVDQGELAKGGGKFFRAPGKAREASA